MQFSYETPLRGKKLELNKKYHYLNKRKHFGWHGKKFLNSQKLLADSVKVNDNQS